MKVPEKLECVKMFITIDTNERQEIETIANGLISKVNQKFLQQGYSVDDAFIIGSENGFNGSFYITVKPTNDLGDSQIVPIDDEKNKQCDAPTLEALTDCLIKAVQQREGLISAYVRRSDIKGIEFLENYIVNESDTLYIIKQ